MRGIPQIPIQSNILGRYWNEFDPWRPYSYCLLDLALTPQGSVVSGPGGRSFRHDLVLQVNIPGKCRNMSDPWRPHIATNRTQRICYHALVPDVLSGPVSMPRCQGQVMDWTCLRMPHISSSLSIFSTVWQRTLSSGSDWPWGMYLVSDNLSEGSASQVASRTHNFQAEHFIAAKWSKWFSSLVSGLTVAADWLYSCCLKGRGLCPPAIV